LDAQQAVYEAVMDSAWIASSALRHRPLLVFGAAWVTVYRDAWTGACRQLRIAIPELPGDVAAEVAGLLATADDRARLVLGVGPAWIPLPGHACPDCRRRTVEAEVSSPDERDWIARCRNGCWIRRVQDDPRARLADSAVLRSIRRQYAAQRRREKAAA
jgi:hypothetical protein